MTTLWSRDREIQEIARKVPDPLSMKAGSGNETSTTKAFGPTGDPRTLMPSFGPWLRFRFREGERQRVVPLNPGSGCARHIQRGRMQGINSTEDQQQQRNVFEAMQKPMILPFDGALSRQCKLARQYKLAKAIQTSKFRLALLRSHFSYADLFFFVGGLLTSEGLLVVTGLVNMVGTASCFRAALFFPRPNDCVSRISTSKQDFSKCWLHGTEYSV